MRPLRPATDHCLGGPLPHQLANRPQPPPPAILADLCSGRHMPSGCYAVLARVSPGYPPLEGRLATCYSPVRHFTHPLRDFLVRLACVRHAASVDSEPGSNSRLKSAHIQGTEALHANIVSSPARYRTGRRVTRPIPCRNGTRRVAQLCVAPDKSRKTHPAHTIDVACSTQLSKNSLLRVIYCGAPEHGVSRPGRPVCIGRLPGGLSAPRAISNHNHVLEGCQ